MSNRITVAVRGLWKLLTWLLEQGAEQLGSHGGQSAICTVNEKQSRMTDQDADGSCPNKKSQLPSWLPSGASFQTRNPADASPGGRALGHHKYPRQ